MYRNRAKMDDDAGDSLPRRFESTRFTTAAQELSGGVVEILWRRRWTILATTVLAVAVAAVYFLHATPLYRSTARIYVAQAGPRALEGEAPGVVARWNAYLHTQAQLLQGTELLSAALQLPGMAQLKTLAGASYPVGLLQRGLEVEVGKQDEILNISFTCAEPNEAAQVVNAVVNAYIQASNRYKSNLSADVVKILQEERAKRNRELNQQREAILAFELNHEGLIAGAERDDVAVRTLERLRMALADAQLATVDGKSYWEMCKKMVHDPSGLRKYVETQGTRGSLITAGRAATLEVDLQRLERERADYLQRLRADTPAIAALDAEMARMRQQLLELDKEFAATQVVVAEQQYLAAQEREKELRVYFEQERRAAALLNDKLAQYALLQSDYRQTQAFRDLLDERIRVLSVDPQVASFHVEIIEAAQPRSSPSKPQAAKTFAVALCMGLFVGVGLSLRQEWKNQPLRSSEEISSLLDLPVLGVIPAMAFRRLTPILRGRTVHLHPDSREAEAFRMVRTTLFYQAPSAEVKTILITSPVLGEGKSTVISNLAISIAQAGQTVVVVDADLRRPMQHVLFGLRDQTRGLASVLAGKLSLEQAIQRTNIENLSVLPCGPILDNPAEWIGNESFTRIMRQLAERYDRVLVDSPPVAVVTDAQILATRCDTTVLVLRAHKSTRKVSLQAYNTLINLDARILGVIVNDLPLNGDQYGYSGYYRKNGHQRRSRPRIKEDGKHTTRSQPREPLETT